MAAEARKLGMPPEQLALDSLRERFMPLEIPASLATGQETLADFLREDIGVCIVVNISLAGHACPKTVGKNLWLDRSRSVNRDGNGSHGYWSLRACLKSLRGLCRMEI